MNAVIDASVALAAILDEPTGDVEREFAGGLMSAVNYSEVIGKLVLKGFSDEDAVDATNELGLTLVPFTDHSAVAAGLMIRATRGKGLSLGDRACLALALQTGSRAITADRAWAELEVGIPIEVIR